MIRVAFDAQIAGASRAGIGQFTTDLARALEQRRELTVASLVPAGRRKDFSVPERIWWDQVEVPRLAARCQADVILKPGFSVPLRSRRPVVSVLHDLAVRRFPQNVHAPSAWFYGRFVPWTLRRAAAIVTISEFTAREAVELLGLPRERMTPVLLGGDEAASPNPGPDDDSIAEALKLPSRYVLHIGTIEPRKNLAMLVRSFAAVAGRHSDVSLLLAGKPGWNMETVKQALADARLGNRIRLLGGVTDDQKRVLLRRAELLAFPSTYEGFGLPPLEAMRSGTPVLANDCSAITEVVGDAGRLLKEYTERAWTEALDHLLSDADDRARLSSAGLRRAKDFSWTRVAEEYSAILTRVAHANRT